MNACRTVSFVIPGPPVAKGRPRTFMARGGRVVTTTPPRTRDYEAHVKRCAQLALPGCWDCAGEMRIALDCYLHTRRKVDCDNLAKSCLDGLNGVVWDDDSQVCELLVRRFYDRERPRVEVSVQVVA